MKREGGGVRQESSLAQRLVSLEIKVVSLACGAADAAAGVRREIVSTREIAGFARRVLRMWLPCYTPRVRAVDCRCRL